MREIIPTIAVYLVMVILAVIATVGGYNFISVILDNYLGVESCDYRKTEMICSTFDKERFVDALAMLLVSKPSLLALWFVRKKV